ncbi:MAG: YjgP/YjgQ family permease [Candidatus Riflebacteria bacterium]|nr:YjgP/YjgQ family permease [Candidatus Riflebacteria bacterium]
MSFSLKKPLKIIDKYVLTELLEPFLFGLAFFVTIWLIDIMMELINLVFSKGVPLAVVIRFFVYSLLPSLAISFPMALLLATLIGYGRMSSDSEVIALKAGGYSFSRIAAPAVAAGLFITGLTLFFNEKLVPEANRKFTELFRREVTLKRPLPNIAENRFFEAAPGRKFFVRKFNPETKEMEGVVMYESQPSSFPRVIEAAEARIEQGVCYFENGRISDIHASGKDNSYTYFETMSYPIDTHYVDPNQASSNKNARNMNMKELYYYIKELEAEGMAESVLTRHKIEFWTKSSIPFAGFIFVLIGAPLGSQTTRSGTSIGIGLSLIIIFCYYIIMAAGKAFAKGGMMSPFMGVWLPNFIVGIIGVFLITRAKA